MLQYDLVSFDSTYTKRLEAILSAYQTWGGVFAARPDVTHRLDSSGLNHLYLLEGKGTRGRMVQAVLKINASNDKALRVDRRRETTILQSLRNETIAPKLFYTDSHQGYSITEYLDGRTWTKEDFNLPANMERLYDLLQRFRVFTSVSKPFHYGQHLLFYWQQVKACRPEAAMDLASEWRQFANRLNQLETPTQKAVLCHHDIHPGNIIEIDNSLRLLDWEYAANGHPIFDYIYIQQQIVNPEVTVFHDAIDALPVPDHGLFKEAIYWTNTLWHFINGQRLAKSEDS